MTQILIIGIGNPLRGDDGLGWHVARNLSIELVREDVQVLAIQQLTPEISEIASHADRILFIDAAREGKPGTLNCIPLEPSMQSARHSHALSPGAVLTLAQELYRSCPSAHLITVAGDFFGTSDALSPVVSASLPSLKAQVLQLIDQAFKGDPAKTGS